MRCCIELWSSYMVGELLEINCLLKLSLLSTQGALALLVFISKGKGLGYWKITHAAEGKSRHEKKKMLQISVTIRCLTVKDYLNYIKKTNLVNHGSINVYLFPLWKIYWVCSLYRALCFAYHRWEYVT